MTKSALLSSSGHLSIDHQLRTQLCFTLDIDDMSTTEQSKDTMAGESELRALDDEILDLEFDRDPAKKYATAYDLRDMAALGLTPAFRRRFNFLAMVGFSSTVVTPWEATLATFSFALFNGGTGGLFCTLNYGR